MRHPYTSIDNFLEWNKNYKIGIFLDQPFDKRHRVFPPTFHKICVYAISFRRLCNFSKTVLISREYLVHHFRLTFCRILLLLSFQKMHTFMGFPLRSCALRLRKSITWFTLGWYLNFMILPPSSNSKVTRPGLTLKGTWWAESLMCQSTWAFITMVTNLKPLGTLCRSYSCSRGAISCSSECWHSKCWPKSCNRWDITSVRIITYYEKEWFLMRGILLLGSGGWIKLVNLSRWIDYLFIHSSMNR